MKFRAHSVPQPHNNTNEGSQLRKTLSETQETPDASPTVQQPRAKRHQPPTTSHPLTAAATAPHHSRSPVPPRPESPTPPQPDRYPPCAPAALPASTDPLAGSRPIPGE